MFQATPAHRLCRPSELFPLGQPLHLSVHRALLPLSHATQRFEPKSDTSSLLSSRRPETASRLGLNKNRGPAAPTSEPCSDQASGTRFRGIRPKTSRCSPGLDPLRGIQLDRGAEALPSRTSVCPHRHVCQDRRRLHIPTCASGSQSVRAWSPLRRAVTAPLGFATSYEPLGDQAVTCCHAGRRSTACQRNIAPAR
jgi:hypothetical protein